MAAVPDETWALDTKAIGRRVHAFQTIDSTNTYALTLAKDAANNGLAVLAKEQTGGRGQYGRTWTAPAHSSVLLSVLIFPPLELRRPALLTAWAAVAVCETILAATGLQAKIKWPNDVLIQGKKVCGILTEQRTTGVSEHPLATVVGIGLNVQQDAGYFAAADLPQASSLRCQLRDDAREPLDTLHVAKALMVQLDQEYARLLEGDLHTLESLWKSRLGLLGKQVRLELMQGSAIGRLLDVAWDGLVLQAESGDLLQVPPERVKHVAALNALDVR